MPSPSEEGDLHSVDSLLLAFEDWLRTARGLRGAAPQYAAVAKTYLRTVPSERRGYLPETIAVVESYSLTQRAVARTALRRLSEFFAETRGVQMAAPPDQPRGGSRRLPPSEVLVALGFLSDRIAPSSRLLATLWGHVRANGAIHPAGEAHALLPAPETLFALHTLSRWRRPAGPQSPLVALVDAPDSPTVTATQFARWLAYRSEAINDSRVQRLLREAFVDVKALTFPSYSYTSPAPVDAALNNALDAPLPGLSALFRDAPLNAPLPGLSTLFSAGGPRARAGTSDED